MDQYVNNHYVENVRGSNFLITYRILHISDIAVDPYYEVGTNANCRLMRCCHLDRASIRGRDNANYFGDKNCDLPLDGARELLQRLKAEIEASFDNGEIINMVVVTGNVVTHQPGQLDARDHVDTFRAVYEMLAEVFDESFIFPVIGSDDTYPQGYYPF